MCRKIQTLNRGEWPDLRVVTWPTEAGGVAGCASMFELPSRSAGDENLGNFSSLKNEGERDKDRGVGEEKAGGIDRNIAAVHKLRKG